jgi:mannose-6-phosphate isomerase-like protein (cupin superfamily)
VPTPPTCGEHGAPLGDSPLLHVRHTEDELFLALAGRFRIVVGVAERRVGPGDVLLAPKGVPPTYRVESQEVGRWIPVTAHEVFDGFVLAV